VWRITDFPENQQFATHTLGNPLAVEVREFLDQYQAARTSGARVMIVGDLGAAIGRKSLSGFHHFSPRIRDS